MSGRSALRFILLLLLAVSPASCRVDEPSGPILQSQPDRSRKVIQEIGNVLFMGNSLTYVNQLPQMVDSIAAASGISIRSAQIASGGFALVDHWNVPSTRTAVENGHYRYVIMQQGPSSLPENRDSLRIWTALWEPTIKAAGGRPALYAVWPDKSRLFAFPDVSESYRLAAEDVGGLFFPVGDVWLETWKVSPSAPLYGRDNFHPSIYGTYAAAVTILSVLTNRTATTLAPRFNMPPYNGPAPDSTIAATIRSAAAVVIARRWAEAN